MSKTLKIMLVVLGSLVVLYTAAGFWGVPWAITHKLPEQLSQQLGRPVMIQEAHFNPFVFTLQIKGLGIQEVDGSPLVGFDEFFLDFEPLASLSKRAYTFSMIRLGLPFGLVIVRPDGGLNLAELGPPSGSAESQANKSIAEPTNATSKTHDGLPPVIIQQIAIQQGMVEFRDQSRPTPFVAHIVPINLTLDNFSTKKGKENPYSLSAELSQGERITWEGSLVLEPIQSQGSFVLENIQLPGLWAYLQDQFRFEVPQGVATLESQYDLSTTPEGVDVRVSGGNLTIQDFQIREKGAAGSVIAVPLFEVKDVMVDVAKQDIRIPSMTSQNARFVAWINKDGVMNYQSLFAPVESPGGEGNPTGTPITPPSANDKPPSASSQPWHVVLHDLTLDNFTIDFEDRQPHEPVTLLFDSLHFHTADVSLDLSQPLPIDLAFQFNQSGSVRSQGHLGLNPLMIDLTLSLADIDLQPFQPYVAPFVQFAVDSGVLTLKGRTHFQKGTAQQPMLTFQGEMGISQVGLEDPTQGSPFLKWDQLALKNMDLQVEPTAVNLEEVRFVNPAVVVSIDPDGGMNMKRLFAPPGSDSEPDGSSNKPSQEGESGQAPPTPVKIGSINITNLLARFADTSITPNVVTQIEELSGTIQGLSSEQLAKADVKLEGKVDRYAPFHLEGQINPLSEDAYTDLAVAFKNLDLPTVSPYSAKYTGYPIKKGKLNLDLAYKVSEKTLVGENKVLIDQITMGEKVDSPDATSLPIPLALALLKDRKGQIDIDLPVRGNLDDPDFSYGGIVWNALVNLLTKIVTSPFALVGGLLGGSGEDLQYVAFPAGMAEMPSSEHEKLQSLGKALEERPALRLEVAGSADTQVDQPAMAWLQLRKQLQKKKYVQDPAAGAKGVPVSEVELTTEEEARYLLELYTEKFGPLPKEPGPTSEGNVPVPPTSEEQKIKLIESISIDEDQRRLLAQERAQHIRDFLVQEVQVSGDRIFLVEPNLSPVTEGETVRSPLALTAN